MSLTRHMDQVVHSDLHRGSLVVYGLLICDACSLAGCLCTGLRFSHLSSGDSRFIVCNAQCPFLKDGLKWISGFDFGRGHSYRSHNLLAIIRLKSVKTVNDSLPGCWSPYPVLSLPVFVSSISASIVSIGLPTRVPATSWQGTPRTWAGIPEQQHLWGGRGVYYPKRSRHKHAALYTLNLATPPALPVANRGHIVSLRRV